MADKSLSQQSFQIPPLDLRAPVETALIRTLPQLIDYNARVNPDYVFCYQAVKEAEGSSGTDGHTNTHGGPAAVPITMGELQRAIANCSKRLLTELPAIRHPAVNPDGTVSKGPTVALLLESDVTLLIHLFSLLALGVPVALLSARLSSVAIRHLLKETNAAYIITSNRLAKLAEAAPETNSDQPASFKVHLAEQFQQDLNAAKEQTSSEFAPISTTNHYIGVSDRDVVILHSSGTTGLPKTIYQSHKYLLGYATCHERTDDEVVDGLNFSTLPFYHGFGLVGPCLSLSIGKPLWVPSSHTLPTGSSTAKALKETGAKSLMTVPHILEEMCALPEDEGVASLLPMQFVGCGGGPLKLAVGEKLANAGVKVLAHFGTTETGPLAPFFVPSSDYDWHFWRLRQDFDITVKPVPQESSDEEVQYQLIARPTGWNTEFVLQDRLITSKHSPGKDFRAIGRKDDLIVLNTGEKVSPRILESLLCESPLVKSAVAFGDGQFELGVIIEPVTPPQNVEQFKKTIWPIIEEAGRQMDSHARIASQASIIVTAAGQVIARSDKGSVLRKEVYRVFAAEISKAYELMESATSDSATAAIDFKNLEDSLKKIIETTMTEILPSRGLTLDEDIFELGANSLQAVRIRRAIQKAMKGATAASQANSIAVDFVYRNPSVRKMANALRSIQKAGSQPVSDDVVTAAFIKRYSLPPTVFGHTILLTGANGSLGSHTLKRLVEDPSVARVICFNRVTSGPSSAGSSTERLQSTMLKCGEISNAYKAKIAIIRGDPNKPHLALQDDVYSSLCNTVTHVLHCAWPMDFQQLLPSFSTQFRFLQSLLQLCRDAHDMRPSVKPRLLFISSIAVVGQYLKTHGSPMVPEVAMKDLSSTNDFGYGKAKYVCEKIIEDAATTHKEEMEVTLVRVGQMSGSSASGYWNTKEHFPALVRLSQSIAKYPRVEGSLSWLPVDTTAAVLSEILLTKQSLDLVYHLENPVRQDFQSVMSQIATELGQHGATDSVDESKAFVSLDEWHTHVFESLGNSPDSTSAAADEMLAQFFKDDFQRMASGSVILDTFNARKVSPTLRNATEVQHDTIAKYVQAWKEAGFIPS